MCGTFLSLKVLLETLSIFVSVEGTCIRRSTCCVSVVVAACTGLWSVHFAFVACDWGRVRCGGYNSDVCCATQIKYLILILVVMRAQSLYTELVNEGMKDMAAKIIATRKGLLESDLVSEIPVELVGVILRFVFPRKFALQSETTSE